MYLATEIRPWISRLVLIAALSVVSGFLPEAVAAENPGSESPSAVAVGSEAPGFRLQDTDGSLHRLGDLRGKRNLVLIFFRGTW